MDLGGVAFSYELGSPVDDVGAPCGAQVENIALATRQTCPPGPDFITKKIQFYQKMLS